MKKRFLSAALLCVLSVGVLTGCDNENEETDGGDVEYSISITNKDELGETWYVGDSARAVSVELSPTANATAEIANGNLTVESSAPSVIAATGLSLTAQGVGSATITVNWHDATDSVALTVSEPSYESIATINAGIAAGTIADGDTVRFYGRFVGGMEPSTTHLYSGVYLADGEDSLMLYAGNITNVFFEDGEQVINFGDDLAVTATVSAYSGFYEFRPTDVAVLSEAQSLAYGITDPEIITITEDNLESFTCFDVGQFAQATVTYESHSADSSGHITITTTLGTETPLTVYVNYHNGTEQMALINEALLGMSAGTELTVCGVIGWHNGIQICPNFIYVDGEVVTPSEGFIVGEQTAPTELSIVGDDTCYVGSTIQLSVVVDSGANPSVTWSSSNTSVATVDSHGLVSGVGAGDVTITATSTITDGLSATHDIVVKDLTGPVAISEWDNGGYYVLGFTKGGVDYFSDGKTASGFDYEGTLVSEYEEATVFQVSEEGGVTYLSYENNDATYYLYLTERNNFKGEFTISTEKVGMLWDSENECFTDLESEYFLTWYVYSDTYYLYGREVSNLSSYEHVTLYDYQAAPTRVDEIVSEEQYVIGMQKGGSGNIQYDAGTNMNLSTAVTDISQATLYTVTYDKTNQGYTLVTSEGKYLGASNYSSSFTTGYTSLTLGETASYWSYDESGLYTTVTNSNTPNPDVIVVYAGINSNGYYEGFTADQTFTPARLYSLPEYPDPIAFTILASRDYAYVGYSLSLEAKLYPTCIPTGEVTWSVDDSSYATIESGVLTGVSAGSVTVTATLEEDIVATYEVTILAAPSEEDLATATYTFTSDGSSTSQLTADGLAKLLVTEDGADNPLIGVSAIYYVYHGAGGNSSGSNPNTGLQLVGNCLKLGSSSYNGSFTLDFGDTQIMEVSVKAAAWSSTAYNLTINNLTNSITQNASSTEETNLNSYEYAVGGDTTLAFSATGRVLIFSITVTYIAAD